MQQELGTYYDRLERWTALARLVGYGGGRDRLTVHRALADPKVGGKPTVRRLHDLLLESLPPLDAPRVLDAGCGFGGTMIDLATRLGGQYTGLTLSAHQAHIGRRAIARMGLDTRVAIRVCSYESPPEGEFDLILAIESLAHSPDPRASLTALASRLAPRGLIVIVDDVPAAGAAGTPELETFKAGWRLPVLWAEDEITTGLRACGLAIVMNRDLSESVRPRSVRQIARLEALNRLAHRWLASAGLREMLDSYRGGLALERLYRSRLMHYRLLIARRDEALAAGARARAVDD
jgi:SAM-dependent methyltransferase